MATTTASASPERPPTGKFKRIFLFALIGLLIAAAGGAAAWFFLLHREAPASAAHAAPPQLATPVFFPLESMTVNLQSDDDGLHYLRIGLTLKLTDPTAQDYLTQHMPEIRSRILLALSNKRPSDLATLDGKRALADELRALIEKPTQPGNRSARVDAVLFTDFVVQ
ncbi:flagellar basal body-associated protein FliL [Burkholderia glumae]|uniref:Flagellar protein FliL n=1 Tax=Burkholderia glumae TaxID=337 RepID=A0AAP9XZH6_BURGL|nr:flagellar basal body-associated protein FliL [Burkholderia glumae]ACR27228.1 Flagellar protein FliL [Burkholderia glumae BGR1]AJY65116.1 flagellar basal body-associated FliL family protein [Burkholderia glumae LMG 2196 = ATCC 33617]KHJ61238.1 flagellar basal body protein FliL [Burkholderia glumae]MCM2481801.1 flagellar basal body-associated protein FliL [Burkholderia glumae]MCM2491596.1 flagellar basal body-associated protein FliL [Burkholderia glumae]